MFKLGRRAFHSLPDIGFSIERGIPGLLSSKGLKLAWFDYQTHLLNEINTLIEKRPELANHADILSLHQVCFQSSELELQRVASLTGQAFNNQFFFTSLLKDGSRNPDASFRSNPKSIAAPTKILNMPPNDRNEAGESHSRNHHVYDAITRDYSFGSVETFRDVLLNRGDAIFGNGAVWFVSNKQECGILNTYGSGTPLSRASQPSDPGKIVSSLVNSSTVYPVFGINLWEHVYLTDYGVDGKRQFLINAFDCLDWKTADNRLEDIKYIK